MDTKRLRELAMAAKGNDPERGWPFKTQAYIRAADPATILALLDRLEAAETKLHHATMAADAEAGIVDELKAKLEAAEKGQQPAGYLPKEWLPLISECRHESWVPLFLAPQDAARGEE